MLPSYNEHVPWLYSSAIIGSSEEYTVHYRRILCACVSIHTHMHLHVCEQATQKNIQTQGCKNFPQICEPPQNAYRQKGGWHKASFLLMTHKYYTPPYKI
jgi:hypothetical protein